jgi:hypothetical protein
MHHRPFPWATSVQVGQRTSSTTCPTMSRRRALRARPPRNIVHSQLNLRIQLAISYTSTSWVEPIEYLREG